MAPRNLERGTARRHVLGVSPRLAGMVVVMESWFSFNGWHRQAEVRLQRLVSRAGQIALLFLPEPGLSWRQVRKR